MKTEEAVILRAWSSMLQALDSVPPTERLALINAIRSNLTFLMATQIQKETQDAQSRPSSK